MLMKKSGSVAVIGAGIAGMQASLDLADAGYRVYLIEKEQSIGGNMVKLDKTFPTGDCAMCTISPKMVAISRNPDIVKLTMSEVVRVEGEAGNYTITVKRKPKYVVEDKCNGCGECAEVCPVYAPSSFDAGIKARKAIDIPFPQAVPLVYAIDKRYCINCRLCDAVCGKEAIDHEQKEEEVKLRVGAIVLATGYELYNPAALEEYGYGRIKNVLSNLQFERMLSPSGPTGGHVIRPSDGEPARRIAFVQCVGSRDVRHYPYCSKICCMASTKEAIVAKEHDPEIKAYVLYMDLRSFGKGFQEYVNKAKEEYGVEYIRGRVSQVMENPATGNPVIYYEDTEQGKTETLEADLVILACALKPSATAMELAVCLGIETDDYGFYRTLPSRPLETLKPGIYVTGTCREPKDIPDSVAEASGAAAKAEALLAEARRSEIARIEKPPQRDVAGEEPRVGVFVCHCGLNIAGVVDVTKVAEYSRTLRNVVYATNMLYTCSQETQEELKRAIREHKLNRVIVAACTPRNLEAVFRNTCEEAGLNPYLFEMANIREHCSWVHYRDPAAATEKAKDLVRMAVAKARLLTPEEKGRANIEATALVIGGGIAGMQAALEIARQGFKVELVEQSSRLGGALNEVNTVFIQGLNPEEVFGSLRKEVAENKNITLHLNSKVESAEGYTGNFRVVIKENGEEKELTAGAILLATGSREFKPHGSYRYGEDDRVLTLGDLEKALKKEGFTYGSVAFIQCVGARDGERSYCSRTCCIEAVKNALILKQRNPETKVYILYRDMMTPGFYENYYRESQEKYGIKYLRYSQDKPPRLEDKDGKLGIVVYDTLLGEEIALEVDKLVLSTPQVPAEGVEELQKVLRVPFSPDGFFMEAHPKLRPLRFTIDGLYLAGNCQAPKELPQVIAQATGAASRIATLLSHEVLETEAYTAVIDEERCIACGRCVDACSFRAISLVLNERGEAKAEVNPAMCKGCGACSSVCPNAAITARLFTTQQILAMIDELLEA
jgi:heterodisulfide reductase subunit A